MRKRIIFMLAAMAILVTTIGTSAFAVGEFKRADRSSKSNLVVVGDSRIYGTYASFGHGKDTSFSALVGGNYGKGRLNIITSEREAWIKKCVQNCLKKKGSCRLVIEGTTNEVGYYGNNPSANAKHILAFAKRASKWSAKGKKPRVYITEAIGRRNGALAAHHASYNKYLSAHAKSNGAKYINLANPKSGDYVGDGIHFTKTFSGKMHKDIASKAK